MSWRQVCAVLLHLGAMAVPVTVLVLKYGLTETVATDGPEAIDHLGALALAAVAAFTASMVGGALLRRDTTPSLAKLAETLVAMVERESKRGRESRSAA